MKTQERPLHSCIHARHARTYARTYHPLNEFTFLDFCSSVEYLELVHLVHNLLVVGWEVFMINSMVQHTRIMVGSTEARRADGGWGQGGREYCPPSIYGLRIESNFCPLLLSRTGSGEG